jgi:hypothetical protein
MRPIRPGILATPRHPPVVYIGGDSTRMVAGEDEEAAEEFLGLWDDRTQRSEDGPSLSDAV